MKIPFNQKAGILAFLLSFVCLNNGYGQYALNTHLNTPDPAQTSFYSPDGKTHDNFTGMVTNFNDVANMKGSSFFMAEWLKGVVYFKNGKQYNTGDLQFDWVKNELHFRYNGKACIFVDSVDEFFLFDTLANSQPADFRNGYPALGMQTNKSFYQVVASGTRFQLLKYWTKVEREIYNYGDAYAKEYSKVADWYIYDVKNNRLKYTTLKPGSVKKALGDVGNSINNLLGQNTGRKINADSLIVLINNLNNL